MVKIIIPFADMSRQRFKAEKELNKKNVSISRVSKVVKGGKRFKFLASVVTGDGNGSVGYGAAKANEVPDSVKKATDVASRSMIKIPLKDGRTIHQTMIGRYGAAKVLLRSAPKGTGVIAGGAMRCVFEVMGVQDVVAKVFRSTNPHNVVKATLAALQNMETPRTVAMKRGKKVASLFFRKTEKDDEVES